MKMFFDSQDYKLLGIVRDILNRDVAIGEDRYLLAPHLSPHGIRELVGSRGLRIAYSVAHLLSSLETEGVSRRLSALRSLRDEVLAMPKGALRMNTARVLIQIMKKLVRSVDDEDLCLELAHNFHEAATGKPRVVREFLDSYYLLEMPEEWNHIAFDHRVHDANSKGRKSPTHLIMDAWIKGIRSLTVVYYNHVGVVESRELYEAARIMDIEVKVGIEYQIRWQNRTAALIWTLDGFDNGRDFERFIQSKEVVKFLSEGLEVSRWLQKQVIRCVHNFNKQQRVVIEEDFGVICPEICEAEFLAFVGTGQPSFLHLGRYILEMLMPVFKERVNELKAQYELADESGRVDIKALVEIINKFDIETVIERFICSDVACSIDGRFIGCETSDPPELMNLSPEQFVARIRTIASQKRITLVPDGLTIADIICILYKCGGMVRYIEELNLKRFSLGTAKIAEDVHALRQALNDRNLLELKNIISRAIRGLENMGAVADEEVLECLHNVLSHMGTFSAMYGGTRLQARIGSGSSGIIASARGMGLVVADTLPDNAAKKVFTSLEKGECPIPAKAEVCLDVVLTPKSSDSKLYNRSMRFLRTLPLINRFGYEKSEDWRLTRFTACARNKTNIAMLGGLSDVGHNFTLDNDLGSKKSRSFRYMNSSLKNALKILCGFIPAFLTFALTKDWWLLRFFGAFIWFGITGWRNITQAVLGGGGFIRSPLSRWNDHVSWSRISDSLLFTGFSVPLLDFFVKTLLLDHGFGVNTHTNPILLYAVMGLANGLYIFSHNMFRGLPRSAAFWNLLRSIISVPLAVVLSDGIGLVMGIAGVVAVDMVLQTWAAVISKLASDMVAGIIEGMADRHDNIRMRLWDYQRTIKSVFDCYTQLEMMFPERNGRDMLYEPVEFISEMQSTGSDLEKIFIINALDLMRFWMFQPRARTALRVRLKKMTNEEKSIFLASQNVLLADKEISRLLVDGLIGKNFGKPLAFYLDHGNSYLEAMKKEVSTA
ncbi:hypothetical protein [Maridesulfovibrio ferrireducens]|uniref:hypothetical protein n=1 Tax=Maridesulfovibrio ferrireducens TaxID=246191 RepID=UPI001A3476BA|nr:hypothetical protein [Maridesulfovibrio ferrireducens]MBI9112510.1 hypothetical protein [Maridesulfovibrio ferrireducens]